MLKDKRTMSNILARILAEKRREVQKRKERGLFFRPFWQHKRRSLKEALSRGDGFKIIAELKRASPSKGLIAPQFDPLSLARAYQEAGAAAISCLTDETFFKGHLEYLAAVRDEVSLPLLRKDFIIDEVQLEEARAFGADAVLLIVAALSLSKLKSLLETAKDLGLEVLVEVHDEKELECALAAGAEIIGVNNRNLKTFEVKLETSIRLRGLAPENVLFVAESGIKGPEDVRRLKEAGISAALIGESLVRAKDPKAFLKTLLSA